MLAHKLLSSAGGTPSDPNFEYVTLLLQGDGTNGGQNNTFLDSSANNFAITRNGNTTQGSFSPYGDLWSNYFDGSGDNLRAPNSSAFDFGTNNLTAEAWVYLTAYPSVYGNILVQDQNNPAAGSAITLGVWPDGQASWYAATAGSGYSVALKAGTIPLNTWTHVAGVRNGSTWTLYVNGASVASTSAAITISQGGSPYGGLCCGGSSVNGYNVNGFISNARVVNGTALYTSNFTPSTTPLTAVSGTSLLTCQSNRFRDASSNNFTITRNGDVRVTRFSPFNPTAAYSASVIGGSGYFDGSGDYLTASSNSALDLTSGDFTIECWIFTSTTNSVRIIDKDGRDNVSYPQYTLSTNGSGKIEFLVGTGNSTSSLQTLTTTTSYQLNAWNHIAATRSGSTLRLFLNGVQEVSATQTATMTSGNALLSIGARQTGDLFFPGFISNVRIVKGTALYTSNFTPPTAPLTAITNTSLLLNFTNGAIFDGAMQNDLETVGNAQISTSVKKFGTGSIAFDGSGDQVKGLGSPVLDFGTGDFTVEAWSYLTAAGNAYRTIYGLAYSTKEVVLRYGDGGFGQKLQVGVQSDSTAVVWSCAATQTSHLNQWVHLAFTRQSGVCRLFVNGVQQSINSGANPSTYPVTSFTDTTNVVGSTSLLTGSNNYAGYIDDLRITKGVARYTANFTPPTAPFPNK